MSESLKRRALMALGILLLAAGLHLLMDGRRDRQVVLVNGSAQTANERVRAAPGWGLLCCVLGGSVLVSVARRP